MPSSRFARSSKPSMKPGFKDYFLLSLVFAVLAGMAGGLALWLEIGRQAPTTLHVQEAQLTSGPGGSFAPLFPKLETALPTDWRTVTLPYTWPQSLALQT